MLRRGVNLCITLQAALALCALLPAHHHHDGGGGHADEGISLDVGPAAVAADGHGEEDHHPDDPSHCAICLFASALASPLPPPDPVAALALLTVRPAGIPQPVLESSFVPTLHGRAPPAAA